MISSLLSEWTSELIPLLGRFGSGVTVEIATHDDKKYSSNVSGLHPIDMLIWSPTKHVFTFHNNVVTFQSWPHGVRPVCWYCLSQNCSHCIDTIPIPHSTVVLYLLMMWLKTSWFKSTRLPWNSEMMAGETPYAWSPYKYHCLPSKPLACDVAHCTRSDSTTIWASWQHPSYGLLRNRRPSGVAMNCHFKAWTLLWPLYALCWSLASITMGWTVPLMAPQKFGIQVCLLITTA